MRGGEVHQHIWIRAAEPPREYCALCGVDKRDVSKPEARSSNQEKP